MSLIARCLPAAVCALAALGACENAGNAGAGPSPEVGVAVGVGGVGVGVDVGGGPVVPPGTPNAAEINCMDRIHARSGGSARLVSVTPTPSGVTLVKAAGLWGVNYTCFANPDGEVARVMRDPGFGWF